MSRVTPPPAAPTPPKHAVLVNLAALAVGLTVLIVFLLITFSKQVKFEASCETLPIPEPLTVDLVNPGTTVLAAAEAIAFNGDAHGAAILFDPSGKDHLAPVRSRAFQLEANLLADQSRSGLRIGQFKDPFGQMRLDLSPPALLQSTGSPGQAPKLVIGDVLPDRAKLTISAMQMDIGGNDYLVSGLAKQNARYKDFSAQLQNGGLILQPGPQPHAEVTLTFQRNSGALLLPIGTPTGATTSQRVRFAFGECVDARVQMDGKNLEGLAPDTRSDYTIISASRPVYELSILGDPKDPQAPTLHVRATALTSSLTQNGRNLVPNVLQEAYADPLATRNLWGLLLAAVLAVILEVLRRSVNKGLDKLLGT